MKFNNIKYQASPWDRTLPSKDNPLAVSEDRLPMEWPFWKGP